MALIDGNFDLREKNLTPHQRKTIAQQLEKLLLSDQQEDGYELYLIKKQKDILGVL